ncbi:MAG: Dyp-type peroxidase [Methylocella sp.]
MAVELDLADIQGNILTAYGKEGFPKGRFMLFHIEKEKATAGRNFVTGLLPLITTALRWPSKQHIPTGKIKMDRPKVTVNIAFTWYGLVALGIPIRTLSGMPDEFINGMAARAPMLGDDFKGRKWKDSWDEVWINSGRNWGTDPDTVHILVTLNAQMNSDGSVVAELEEKTRDIERLCGETGGVRLLTGHNPRGQRTQRFQELSALLGYKSDGTATPLPKEHFGFTDGLGDPVFDGQYPDDHEQFFKIGNGVLDGNGNWRPLATGEFLLGYPDEAQEIAGAAMPHEFSRNGTFMAYRKLHQNVAAFRKFIKETAQGYARASGIGNCEDASEILKAKMAGRWPDGVPTVRAPAKAEWDAFNKLYPDVDYNVDPAGAAARYAEIAKFTFGDDKEGIRCPLTAHLRRVNTRDMLDPSGGQKGSILNNRRRILRRGLPYGESPEGTLDEDEHGIVMLMVCAGLFRQFEFVQQQWINYGNDSRAGNDTCPIVGNHSDGTGSEHGPKAKFVIPADPAAGQPPFIVEGLPQFVETRGGEYFFVPSMTALRMIGMGVVDPT